MRKLTKIAAYAFCLLVLSICNCTAQTDTKGTIHKEFKGISYIDISTVSGSCEVVKSDGQEVKIELTYNYTPANSFEAIFDQDDNVLILEEKMHGSNSGHSKWRIAVPEHIRIKFGSASGGITFKDIAGKLKVNTASGNIDAEGIKVLGNSEFSSASGSVHITLDESPAFDVLASSASGDATIDFDGNPVVGNIEMQSRTTHGKIICPYTFDVEKEKLFGNQKYMIKSFTAEQTSPIIKIQTASGKAVLKK